MNAHENPFRSSAVASFRYRLSGAELDGLAERACGELPVCAIVGPEGTGKTTLLEDLAAPIQERDREVVWVRLNRDSAKQDRRWALATVAGLSKSQTCLLDGGEILNFWEWRRLRAALRRNQAQLIASLHHSRGIPVLHATAPDWEVAWEAVNTLGGRALADRLEPVARASFGASRGNVREVLRTCYWACARLG